MLARKMRRNRVDPVVGGASPSSFPAPPMPQRGEKCSFCFVDADMVRAWEPSAAEPTLPRHQELLKREGWIEEMSFSLEDAFPIDGGSMTSMAQLVLTVSHRWEEAARPDVSREQIMQIKKMLKERPNFKYIW